MKVYVTFEECQEDRWIVGVFDKEEEAIKCEKITKSEGRYGASVEEWEVKNFFQSNNE